MLFIGGDFNAKIGLEGEKYEGVEGYKITRKSKYRVVNNEGKEMIGLLEDRRWEMENGNNWGDKEGEWTYGGRGSSVVETTCHKP